MKYFFLPNIGPKTTHERWISSSGANDDPAHACRLNRVNFLNIGFILIIELYN